MKNFEEIYKELETENIDELEKYVKTSQSQRKKIRKKSKYICIVADVVILIFFVYWIKMGQPCEIIIAAILGILVLDIFIFICTEIFSVNIKSYNKYNLEYKNTIISKIISNFYSNLLYIPEKSMPEEIYRQVEERLYDEYASQDYFEAILDGKYPIQMAEILSQKENDDEDSNFKYTTVFDGILTKIVMRTSINWEIKILCDGSLYLGDKLKMDSEEFEKKFDVKASTPILGMQLLTADVMLQLIRLKDDFKVPFDIYIKNNDIYIKFYTGNMFELNIVKQNLLDEQAIRKCYDTLNLTYSLSSKLISAIENSCV